MEPKYNPNTPEGGAKTDPAAGTNALGKQIMEEARSETERISHRVQSEGRKFFVEKKNLAAENVRGFAEAFRMTARNLEEQSNPTLAGWAHRAADVVSGWSDTLRDSDMNELSSRAKGMIRRNKGLLVGGAFVVGFALSRFLKASYEPVAPESGLMYRRRQPMEESLETATIAPRVAPLPATDIDPERNAGTPSSKKSKPYSGFEP
jgi:hypothetical protein